MSERESERERERESERERERKKEREGVEERELEATRVSVFDTLWVRGRVKGNGRERE